MRITLGELVEVDSRKAARAVQTDVFAHALINRIIKYRAEIVYRDTNENTRRG